ncbi:MAG: hypothetical protein NC336_00890 [Clostridium sp.]|nr:hypothetical protein [Clostridium sp.]
MERFTKVQVMCNTWVVRGFPKQCYNYTYDCVSRLNITALTRRGPLHAFGYGLVDDLTMDYDGDRVMRISDAADRVLHESSPDFDDGADCTDEIAYDANGNMIRDLNRVISCIRYNALGLPAVIEIDSTATIGLRYNAEGRLIERVETDYNRKPSGGLPGISITPYPGGLLPGGNAGNLHPGIEPIIHIR